MLVKKDSKITEVQLANGNTFTIGNDHGDGRIFSIRAGEELENEIKDWPFEDWDGNEVPTSKVKLCLEIMDGEDGWSVFMTEDGISVLEA